MKETNSNQGHRD